MKTNKENQKKANESIILTPDNAGEYAQKLNNVLDEKGYVAHATKNGSIEIYKQGDRKALKNLKANISSTDYIDWGGNEYLKDELEPLIKSALKSDNKKQHETKQADAYGKGDGKIDDYQRPTVNIGKAYTPVV